MKKFNLLLVLLCLSLSAYSQVDTTTLSADNKMILKTFKDLHVEKTFKDPYSFELIRMMFMFFKCIKPLIDKKQIYIIYICMHVYIIFINI